MSLAIENGMSTTTKFQSSSIRMTSGRIQDARFVDDGHVMLVVRSNCAYQDIPWPRYEVLILGRTASSTLLSIKYRRTDAGSGDLIYEDLPSVDQQSTRDSHGLNTAASTLELDPSAAGAAHFVQHTFPVGPTWVPERIEINGRKGRRAVCVLARDRLRYRVYDLDSLTPDEGISSVSGSDGDAVMTE